MWRFVVRLTAFCTPLLAILGSYVVFDPFKVLGHYDDYSIREPGPMLNRDRVSTETFITNHPRLNYDSFIFGNSRSLAVQCGDWRQLQPAISPFHFDATGENLLGVVKKLQFIDSCGASIRNVIFVCDAELLGGTEELSGHLFIKDHRVTGTSMLAYHLTFARAWVMDGFFIRFLDHRLTGRMKPSMKGYFEDREVIYEPDTNDNLLPGLEREVAADPAAYRERRKDIFYERPAGPEKTSAAVITDRGRELLGLMRQICDKHQSVFKVAISPLYHQRRLHPQDFKALQDVFGAENVFDFSGINEFTAEISNYYETSHYRPHVGRRILEKIAGKEP